MLKRFSSTFLSRSKEFKDGGELSADRRISEFYSAAKSMLGPKTRTIVLQASKELGNHFKGRLDFTSIVILNSCSKCLSMAIMCWEIY